MAMLGNYLVGEQLGAGGMGVVYDGVDRDGSHVAIKVLRSDRCRDPRAVRRFLDEAVAGQIVRHPHVVSVIGHDEVDGVPFLVMHRVHGKPLGVLIRTEGTPSLRRVLAIGAQILDALDAIHGSGIVHGDVKSDNVLVSRGRSMRDEATLIDLGLAHVELTTTEPTPADPMDEMISGTPEYMSPEVARGCMPTSRSDLYAVGVILYELLTGTTPFAGGSPSDILRRHLDDAVVAPSLRAPARDIPPILERIVMRALNKSPVDRFASARVFANALEIAARGCLDDRPGPRPAKVSCDASTLDVERQRSHRRKPGTADAGRRHRG